MPRATLVVTVPEDVWIGAVTRAHPETTFRVQSARSNDGLGIAVVELVGGDVSRVIDDLAAVDALQDLEVFDRTEDRALVQLEVSFPMLLFPIEASVAPIRLPFELVDGVLRWEIVTTQERLSSLAEQLDTFGLAYTVERIQPEIGFERILTDKQARVVQAALEAGYYDSPRTCTLTELADQLDLAASTCSETLHRAEERIIKRFDAEVDNEHPELTV
ncbi:MAG: helix-turn-helix domain-containing protein [Halobacteriota archaeon]